ALAGGFTLAIGLILTFLPTELPQWAIAALLAGGASTWALASFVFAGIDEPEAEPEDTSGQSAGDMWALVKGDRDLQRFLL
ncbi:MFS transporter, partial [Mycobacterium tuberculosis]|nr:MFS transporter [Mycobacterium tuberculosis]